MTEELNRFKDLIVGASLERHPKLNELSEAQLSAVNEALKEAAEKSMQVGIAEGKLLGMEIYSGFVKYLIMSRTFTASLVAVVMSNAVFGLTRDIFITLISTPLLTLGGFLFVGFISNHIRNLIVLLRSKWK